MSTIIVHHLEFSRSLRVLWALEELGLPYEVRTYQRDSGFRAPAEAQRIHPLGRFPMVEIDGVVLAESGAILEELAERHGALHPTEDPARREYRFFMHYAEGSAMPPLLVQLIVDRLKSAPVPFFLRPVAKGIASKIEDGYTTGAIDLHFGFIEKLLGERPYFCGESFSMADIQMFYPVEAGLVRGAGKRPNTSAWRERVTGRKAYHRAEAKGGPAMAS